MYILYSNSVESAHHIQFYNLYILYSNSVDSAHHIQFD